MLALDCLFLTAMLMMLTLGLTQPQQHLLRGCAGDLGMFGFVGSTVAMAKFLMRGEVIE